MTYFGRYPKILICAPVVMLFFMSLKAFAVELEKVNGIEPAGLIIIHASFTEQNSETNWQISSYTIDENTGVRENQDVIAFLDRDSVRILLVKPANKYSFYKVSVFENNEADSVEFQVINKGVVQKYIFNNPVIPAKPIPVHVILPQNFTKNSKLLFSMHGTDRNADDYANAWKNFATSADYVIAAPEFYSSDWTSSSYILGNMFTGTNGTGSLNSQELWTFSLVKLIHVDLMRKLGLSGSTYIIWGHSAGAQFVHRMALFCPDENVSRYISANAGWYTLPNTSVNYPWGVKHNLLNIDNDDLVEFTYQDLVIMRGTADTLRDSNLNTEPMSDTQGLNRYERAGYYYNEAMKVNPNLSFSLADVAGVGHDYAKMALAAGEYIVNGGFSSLDEEEKIIPKEWNVQSYPNPFNAVTNIIFTVPESGHIKLTVYNLLGEKIITLVDEMLHSGQYNFYFNAANLPSGVYLCVASGSNTIQTKKILLLK